MNKLQRDSHAFKTFWPGILIVFLYLVVGTLYVAYTPIWQAPDEPAHYNYIRSLAEGEGVPVLEPGDYDQAYLSRLTSEGFPPELPVIDVEYEDHQPPLYYTLAVPVYALSSGSVRTLRLFSLILGAFSVTFLLKILREIWPGQPSVAWFGGGLVAFVPQFVAVTASVNNDALTFALLWLWLWLALRYLRGLASPWALGGVAGALLLTKSTGYGVLILMPLLLYLRYRRGGMTWTWAFRQLLAALVPALVLGGLWWGRNAMVYGWPDLMGLERHEEVVIGQPRTEVWIAQEGVGSFLRDATRTTFRSFWGQFGWMGVVLDARIYQALAIFSILSIAGALWRLVDMLREGIELRQRDALLILAASASITLVMYLGYNLTFVQHQGRYLFPALPLLAFGTALGWHKLLTRRVAVTMAVVVLIVLIVIGVVGIVSGDPPLWLMAMLAATLVILPLLASLPDYWYSAVATMALVGMVVLDLWALFGFIVPILSSY